MKKILLYIVLLALLIGTQSVTTAFASTVNTREVVNQETMEQVIESAYTSYSDDTSSMICITAIVPDNFNTTVYARVRNLDTSIIYKLTMYAENNYFDRCYVPAGNYSFEIMAVSGDSANTYSFDFPIKQFYVDAKQSAEYEILLNNYDKLSAQIAAKYEPVKNESENSTETGTEVEPTKLHALSDFDVTHTGAGLGEIGVTGEQTNEYELTIKIVEGGTLGIGTFAYTKDKGKTWSEPIQIPLSGFYSLKGSGLTIEFFLPTNDVSFITGDTYEFYVPNPDTNIVIKHLGNSNTTVEVISNVPDMRAFNVLEKINIKIKIKILKEGDFGKAVWQISKDDGVTWGDQEYAAREIVITSATDANLSVTLRFEPKLSKFDTSNIFERDDEYSIYAERIGSSGGATGIIIFFVIIVGFVVAAYVIYKKLKNAIPKEDSYRIKK